jgi:hypothetical protein
LSVPHIAVTLLDNTGATGVTPVTIVKVFEFPEAPHEFVQVAVYVPAPTSFVRPVVPPADQVIVPSVHPDAVKVAVSVPQIAVLLDTIDGATGVGLFVIVTAFEFGLIPQIFSHTAV